MTNDDDKTIDDRLNALFSGIAPHELGTAGTPLTREIWEQAYGPGSYEEAKKIWPDIFQPKKETI